MMKVLKLFWIVVMFSSPAFCFELRTVPEVSPTAYLRWDLSSGPIRVSLDSKGSADLPVGVIEKSLQRALTAWEDITRQNLKFEYQGMTSGHSADAQDHINLVQWVEKDWQYSTYAIGITSYSYYLDDPPTIIDADIQMNGQNYRWAVSNADNENKIDVEETLIHEIGHLLGLSHTSTAKAQMFPYLAGHPTHAVTIDDRAAVRFLYGTPDNSFRLVTPVRNAIYVRNISERGLPLPVFRWRSGPDSNYVLEFSGAASFAKRIQIEIGPYPFYSLTPQMEKRLQKLYATDRIYWRVRSGTLISPVRSFRFS